MSGRLRVLRLSGAASLQDGGRRGFLRFGLSASGPMDPLAFAASNRLVGNEPGAAALELGLAAATLRAEGGPVRLALAGAPAPLRCAGEPLSPHRTFVLREGDGLPLAGLVPGGAADHWLEPVPLDREVPIRVVLGPQDDHFTQAGLAAFLGETFTVSHRADRMGYQLDGPEIAHGAGGFNIVSDATVAGSVQVPGSGRPIVLMADRQTTGGYPKIATVVSADLRRLAQRRPGDPVRFEAVDLGTARSLALARAAWLHALPERLRPVASEAERLMAANLAGAAVDALGEN